VETVDAERLVMLDLFQLRARPLQLLAVEHQLIPDLEDHQQRAVHHQPLRPQPERPLERHAFQIAEEQRRVAERREQSPAVGDDEDEEDDDVRHPLARRIGAEQWADEQRRRARGPDHARERGADRQDPGVLQRRARQRAPHVDAAGDDEERRQQRDERYVLVGLFEEHVEPGRAEGRRQIQRYRERQQCRHDALVAVVLPPMARRERQERDREQDADEG
jgi:hypothetical protein